jgi:8-amino-7-oxononanoate synthase
VNFPKKLIDKLSIRERNGALRELGNGFDGIDFYSNDYLGLAKIKSNSSRLKGSTGSRLLAGNSEYHLETEIKLATFYNAESALLYNSGYDANLGFFSCLPQRGDTIIYDALIHASIRDGIQLSFANSYSFKHNDLSHLEARLKMANSTVYVAVESVYSMDGDKAPLTDIINLCNEYSAYLVVDEAHAAGVEGIGGRGLVTQNRLDDQVFAKLVTFGKAYGSHGAVWLGSQMLKSYLVNYSKSLIYSTALSPDAVERINFAIATVTNMEEERKILNENILYFKRQAIQFGLKILESETAIQGILIPGNQNVKAVEKRIMQNGFIVKAILSPTVPQGTERLRICLHTFNTKQQIKELLNLLK